MFIIYDLIFLFISIFFLPAYLLRRKFHSGFSRRLGFLPNGFSFGKPIWVHAVSVGEMMAVRGLLEALRKASPGEKIVISTVTATGNKIARDVARAQDFVTYLPLDFSSIVRSVIDRIDPRAFIIAETEIWPNLITCLYRKNIPVIIVNGRISDGSYRGYLALKFLLAPVLRSVSLFCVQTDNDAKRLSRLGVPKDKVVITGNMKFDTKGPAAAREGRVDYRSRLDLDSEDRLLVAGSTHPQEEEVVLAAYKELLNEFPRLKLLIAPRHPERSRDIIKIASRLGFRGTPLSSLPASCPTCIPKTIFILDVIGELVHFYDIADIVFVGGSMVKKGGHNILEAAVRGKPIIFGPHMFNFRDIADLFLDGKAAVMAHGEGDLIIHITRLLNNPVEMAALGARAKLIVAQNQGATVRNAKLIANFL